MPEPAEGRGVQWACEHAPAGPLDIAVQLPAQSLAHRVVCYFTNGSLLVPDHLVPTSVRPRHWQLPPTARRQGNVSTRRLASLHARARARGLCCGHRPSGLQFRMQAEEVGPRTNKDGPGLALLKHVNATPEQFLAWFTEQTWLARLCSRLYMLPHGGAVAQGGTGDMVAAQIAKAGMPTATLRVQVCPRKLEYDIAVRSHAACTPWCTCAASSTAIVRRALADSVEIWSQHVYGCALPCSLTATHVSQAFRML